MVAATFLVIIVPLAWTWAWVMGKAKEKAMVKEWWRVAYFRDNEGYGILSPETWAGIPERYRERVRVLSCCDTKEGARETCTRLTAEWDEWRDAGAMSYAEDEWWEATGDIARAPDGQEVALYKPADRPIPVIGMTAVEITELLSNPSNGLEGWLEPIRPKLLGGGQ